MNEDAPVLKKKHSVSTFNPVKVKKVMQSNPEVGKITTQASVLVAKIAELFLKEIATECQNYTLHKKPEIKTIDNSIIKQIVDRTPGYQFAQPLFAGFKSGEKKERKQKQKKPVSIFKTPESKTQIENETKPQKPISSQPEE